MILGRGRRGLDRIAFVDRPIGRPVIGRLQIDERADPIGISGGEPGQLGAGQRMADQMGAPDSVRVHEAQEILGQRVGIVAGRRLVGGAVAAPRQREHAMVARESRPELLIDPGRIAEPREQDDRIAAPAEIEIMQPDAGADLDHAALGRGEHGTGHGQPQQQEQKEDQPAGRFAASNHRHSPPRRSLKLWAARAFANPGRPH